jgi:hypothetical protein
MNPFSKIVIAGLLISGGVAEGQFSVPGGLPAGFHHALYDVLSGQPAFTGRALVQLSNGPDQPPTSITCNISFAPGKMRVDVDSFVTGTNMPAEEAAKLRAMHSSTIVRPDINRMYLLFPEFRSYVEVASFGKSGSDPAPAPVIGKTPLGKEAVGTLTCNKSQWNITEMNGDHYDITVWTSTNLNNFPVQVRLGPPSALLDFEDLRFNPPDASLFDPPAGYMKYEGIQELILKDTQKAGITNVP